MNLLAELLDTRHPLTIDEIRNKVGGYEDYDKPESFRRVFERDKDELRELGIDIQILPLPFAEAGQTGYRILAHDYVLPDPGLTSDELLALQLAQETVRVSEDESTSAMRQLGGLEAPSATVATVAELPTPAGLDDCYRAVTTAAELSFDYRGERRRVQAHGLRFARGHWYLGGHDLLRQATRVFRLDRIDGVITVGPPGAFEPPDEATRFDLEPWRIGPSDAERIIASVRVDAEQVDRAQLAIGDEPLELHPDGSATLSIEVVNIAAFRSFVLEFGDHAELVSPPELRADLIAWLEEVAAS